MKTDEEEQLPLARDYEARLRTLERLWDEGFHDEPKTVDLSFSSSSISSSRNGELRDDEVKLEESVFSFITAMEPCSVPFLTGIAVVLLKYVMLAFLSLEIIYGVGGTFLYSKRFQPWYLFLYSWLNSLPMRWLDLLPMTFVPVL